MSLLTALVVFVVGFLSGVVVRWVAGLAALVSVSRLVLGLHYLVDVVAGAAIGLVYLAVALRVLGTPRRAFALATTVVYFLGGAVAFWFVFTAIASYRVRNNPHGTVQVALKHRGETRTVELSRDEYTEYKRAVRSDGGETEQVIRELEDRFED